MAVNRLKPPRNLRIEFKPSPRQYELWKLLQPNYCPHCGGEIEQILIGYDQQGNPQYRPQCRHCKSQNLPQLILGGGAPAAEIVYRQRLAGVFMYPVREYPCGGGP